MYEHQFDPGSAPGNPDGGAFVGVDPGRGPNPYGEATPDELSEAISAVHGAEMVLRAELMALVSAFDAAEGYLADGVGSLGSWLSERLDLSRAGGAEMARVSARLDQFNGIASMFASGSMSWDKVVASLDIASGADLDVASDGRLWSMAPT
ncbi:MAG: hypothetical protein ACRD0E_00580, partial [Acidimicrobiales bacterium]